ncbi:MAG: BatA domain-containing protein, partial [Planctomycetaceae bacterium]
MSFLQPWILAALPVMALPVLIHLINRNRHRSVHWGAMMFLVRANRMHKGMARLRYLLIMLLRMAAVGAIVFVVSRPLVSGKLGLMGLGKPDATLILLDRSVSMETQDLQSGESKRSTALRKLSELLEKRGYGSELILIDSATGQAQPIESPRALLDLPLTQPTATSANLPAMFENGLAYLKANEAARADVWICSDLNENDWDPDSGRWAVIREQFAQMKGVHHFLLAYAADPVDNVSVRVAHVKRRQVGKRAELVLDVLLKADATPGQDGNLPRRVPVEFEINHVRSVVELELDAEGASLLGHRIPIDEELRGGWGAVHVPGDANPLDNTFYFVFSEPPVRNSVIVSDDPKVGEAFRLGLAIPAEPGLRHNAIILPTSRVGELDWESTALLIWQAPLPQGLVAEQIQRFVSSGRVTVFFPPSQTADGQLFDTGWGEWQQLTAEHERKLS